MEFESIGFEKETDVASVSQCYIQVFEDVSLSVLEGFFLSDFEGVSTFGKIELQREQLF